MQPALSGVSCTMRLALCQVGAQGVLCYAGQALVMCQDSCCRTPGK